VLDFRRGFIGCRQRTADSNGRRCLNSALAGSRHGKNYRSICDTFQVAERVLYVRASAELARPSAIGKLSCGMTGHVLGTREYSDLLQPCLKVCGIASRIAQIGKCHLHGQDSGRTLNAGWPEFSFQFGTRPPPLLIVARSPGDAVVIGIRRARDRWLPSRRPGNSCSSGLTIDSRYS
jgi:hypothetical protein